jgi:hypothetical protein
MTTPKTLVRMNEQVANVMAAQWERGSDCDPKTMRRMVSEFLAHRILPHFHNVRT